MIPFGLVALAASPFASHATHAVNKESPTQVSTKKVATHIINKESYDASKTFIIQT